MYMRLMIEGYLGHHPRATLQEISRTFDISLERSREEVQSLAAWGVTVDDQGAVRVAL